MRGHLISCLKNPKVIEKVNCQYCNKLFSLIQLKRHEKYCHENPTGSKFNENPNSSASNELRDDLFCRYCNKQCKNLNSQKQHEIRCKENPDRIATAIIENFNAKHAGLTPWNKGLTKETDPRVLSSANSLKGHKCWLGKHHSNESKEKISRSMKKFLSENPDKVPYLLNHSSKTSYPEQYFIDLFKSELIDVQYHYQINKYQLDFCNVQKKIDIEVDGEQHFTDDRIYQSDRERDKFLKNLDWQIYRIRWSTYKKLTLDEKQQIIAEIKSLLT